VVIIERLTVVGVFVVALALGYVISASVLGPGVLAVLLGVLAGVVMAVLFHRSFEVERTSEQPTK
jgi:ABC-type proline/glycine betaine transport system permease subunit